MDSTLSRDAALRPTLLAMAVASAWPAGCSAVPAVAGALAPVATIVGVEVPVSQETSALQQVVPAIGAGSGSGDTTGLGGATGLGTDAERDEVYACSPFAAHDALVVDATAHMAGTAVRTVRTATAPPPRGTPV